MSNPDRDCNRSVFALETLPGKRQLDATTTTEEEDNAPRATGVQTVVPGAVLDDVRCVTIELTVG